MVYYSKKGTDGNRQRGEAHGAEFPVVLCGAVQTALTPPGTIMCDRMCEALLTREAHLSLGASSSYWKSLT